MSLRVAFIGCVAFSQAMLERLLEPPGATSAGIMLVGVVTRRASKFNADFVSLAPQAERAGAPVFFAEDGGQDALAAFLRSVAPDVIYCLGWSSLLGPAALAAAPAGVIGYHPAALPANRGRHPIVWALALGLKETASTFFIMDKGADTGDIVSQVATPIADDDDAATLYARLTDIALTQLSGITADLAAGRLRRRPQNPEEGNSWRKRGPRDGLLDWRMTADALRCLIRALARPYVGAHAVTTDGREAKVWRAEIGPPAPANLEPGRVLAVEEGGAILVKCWDGSILLTEHEITPLPFVGDCLP